MDVPIVLTALIVLVALVLGLAIWSMGWRRLGDVVHGPHRRAEALLQALLTEAEYAQLCQCEYLDVRSPSQPTRTYRVPRWPGRIAVLEDDKEVESLCVTPVGWLPPGDIVLTHKLMIEGDEAEYLRRANHYRYWPVSRSL
jgi:hypothetical protein